MSHLSLEPASYYIYTYACTEEERELCELEQRAFFASSTDASILKSPLRIDPSRSPFIKERIGVFLQAESLDKLIEKVKSLPPIHLTFKVMVINSRDAALTKDKIGYEERREIERKVGMVIPGKPDLNHPDMVLAIIKVGGQWCLGRYVENQSIWHVHQKKPHHYSTALSTRVARAVVNIAAPDPSGLKVVDPCCGIGTVLVEALSMGIDIVGSDHNPLVMKGARENIAHFGFQGDVMLRDIQDVAEDFDVAIIDMPYNLCSVITPDKQLEMLQSARRFTKKMVVVTIEQIDRIIHDAGFKIIDRCEVAKGKFIRQVLVCE